MPTHDQGETLSFLRAQLSHLDASREVETVETHASFVLLGATLAWKVKKAVRLPYLDFSTPARRLAMCERELALNRRTAPALYHRVRRVARGGDGRLVLDAQGPLVEAVLEMARFDEAGLLERMALRGELRAPLVARLAAIVAGFHAAAEISRGGTRGAARVDAVLTVNEAGLAPARRLFGDGPVDEVTQATRALARRHGPLLDRRHREGRVRLTHGDLHLRNIVEIGGEPVLFDCLEFDEALATTDVLYDLAFLLMDLWHRGLRGLANLLFNRYLDMAAEEADGLALMPLFLAMRATVRAHVLATQAEAGGDRETAAEARSYLDLARSFLAPRPARLVAVGGFSGSGKSTFAARIAHLLGPAPGARILSSDRIRKRLFGVAAETRLPQEAYAPEISREVYALTARETAALLAAGHGVIADAVFDRPDTRAAIEAVAQEAGAPFRGLWLEAPQPVLMERVEKRRGDPSDATAEIVRAQMERGAGSLTWRRLDARRRDRP